MILTPLELVEITGYKRAKDQIAWIREHYDIPVAINGCGDAVVFKAHLETAKAPAQNARGVRLLRKAA